MDRKSTKGREERRERDVNIREERRGGRGM